MTDRSLQGLTGKTQEDLLTEMCQNVEELIQHAIDRRQAELAAERICNDFRERCMSRMLSDALTERANAMLERHWGKGYRLANDGVDHIRIDP